MVLVSNFQNLSSASGIIPTSFLEDIYTSFMDDAMQSIGRDVTFHLRPLIQEDVNTQKQIQSAQFNPFFGTAAAPRTNTRQTGTKVTNRDVVYKAQIRVTPVGSPDLWGIGNLKDNIIMFTVVIEAMPYIKDTLSVSIEGRRYKILETRPIGFSQRRFLMIKALEINEMDVPSNERSIG